MTNCKYTGNLGTVKSELQVRAVLRSRIYKCAPSPSRDDPAGWVGGQGHEDISNLDGP